VISAVYIKWWLCGDYEGAFLQLCWHNTHNFKVYYILFTAVQLDTEEEESNLHWSAVRSWLYCGPLIVVWRRLSLPSCHNKFAFLVVFPISIHFILNFLTPALFLSSYSLPNLFFLIPPPLIIGSLCVLLCTVCFSALLLFSH